MFRHPFNTYIFFFLITLRAFAFADFKTNNLHVPETCKGSKNYYSEVELKVLWERGQLPSAFENLDTFLKSMDHLERHNHSGQTELNCSRADLSTDGKHKATELQIVLHRLTKSIQNSLLSDLSEQKAKLNAAINCFSRLDDECRNKTNLLSSEIKKRLYSMRIYMAIAQGVDNTTTPLKHDKSYLQELIQFSYGSHSPVKAELSPLTANELEKVRKIRSSASNTTGVSKAKALEHYFAILGSTPSLSNQDREFDLGQLNKSLYSSFKATEEQIKEYSERPPQDLFLLLPYLNKALDEFSMPQKNVACQLVSYVYGNLEIRDKKFPAYFERILLLSSFSGAGAISKAAGLSVKKEFVNWANRLASRSLVAGTTLSAQTIQKIKSGLQSCEVGLANQSDLTSLCELNRVHSQADKLQTEIIVNTIISGGFYGAARVFKN